jgi:hypothetical protein
MMGLVSPTGFEPGMIVNPKRNCSMCKEPVIYGVGLPIRCEHYKEPDDLNHVEGMILCFNYRPDFAFDCGTHMVVLEVDENQQSRSVPHEQVAPLSVKHLCFDNQEVTAFVPVELQNYGL